MFDERDDNDMIKGFNDCNIYVSGAGIVKTSLAVSDGIISDIGHCSDGVMLPEKAIVVPGFIDEHTHGASGVDTMDGKSDSCKKIAAVLPGEGTTSFLFTTMTTPKANIVAALSAAFEYMGGAHDGANALGVHLEGPFISQKYAGAQTPENIIAPSIDDMRDFISASGSSIRLVTISYKPHYRDFVRYLADNNITVSLGHTDATAGEAFDGIANGIECGTHIFNAMTPFFHRDVGAVGALLLSDNVKCELIADMKHVSADAIKLLYKLKGDSGIILITDAMEAKNMPDGKYKLGGNDVYVTGGEARLKDGMLAGSTLRMNDAVRNVRNTLGISLEKAVDMATINPAINLKMQNKKGSISVGMDADFTVIDDDLNVLMTIVGGRVVYDRT